MAAAPLLLVAFYALGCGGGSGGGAKPHVGADDPNTLGRTNENVLSALPSQPAVNLTTTTLASGRTLLEVLDKFGHIDGRAASRTELPKTPLDYKESLISKMVEKANVLRDDTQNQFTNPDGTVQSGIVYALGARDASVRLNYKTQGAKQSKCTDEVHALDCSGMLATCAASAGLPILGDSSTLALPKTWNDALPAAWRLKMSKVDYTSLSQLQRGDIVAWPGHIGFIAGTDLSVAQSNGRKGDDDGPECKKNLDRAKRGPRYIALDALVNGQGWTLGPPTVLRLEPNTDFTVELNWGAEPDVDLHVYEPAGAHVYYANATGLYGVLDVDDTTSFGPEHYIIDPAKIIAGDYLVGVNYYSGDGPETARLTITSGSQTKNYSQLLTEDHGSSGDDSPIILATIRVAIDVEGKRTITVIDGSSGRTALPRSLPGSYTPKPHR